MTSQPLETIPEELTPAPTPARVTANPRKTKPAKNPGCVESGKRLAKRNRLAREAKKKAEAERKAAARPQERLHHQPRALLPGGWCCFEVRALAGPGQCRPHHGQTHAT